MDEQAHRAKRTEDDAERAWVVRTLAAMIRDAEADADRVCTFLAANGIKPGRRAHNGVRLPCTSGPVADFLLEVGAALRLQSWERAGLVATVAPDLPTAAEVLSSAAARLAAAGTNAAKSVVSEIPVRVFAATFRHIPEAGQSELGADVCRLPSSIGNALFDDLADFLWRHRHLAAANHED